MNKMRDDQDFNIQFVKIIQNERSLYDKTLPEYRSKEEHEKIWLKISTQVNESVAHCKERWRNLRACLTRHLKQQQQAAVEGTINHKPYYLADHMNFLLPYTKSRSSKEQIKYETPSPDDHHQATTSSKILPKISSSSGTTTTYTISTSESDENQYVTLIQASAADLETGHTLEEAQLHVENGHHDADTKPMDEQTYSTPSAKEHLQEIIYEPVAKRVKVVSSQETDDADLNFFRSLLPDIRTMTPSQKRRFKMGIFGLMDNVFSNADINS